MPDAYTYSMIFIFFSDIPFKYWTFWFKTGQLATQGAEVRSALRSPGHAINSTPHVYETEQEDVAEEFDKHSF